MEFIEWTELATYTGSLVMVLIVTQLTKELKIIKTVPTQMWSYFIALAVLYPAYYFTGQLSTSNAVLILFHAVIVALSANGGFDALKRAFPDIFHKL